MREGRIAEACVIRCAMDLRNGSERRTESQEEGSESPLFCSESEDSGFGLYCLSKDAVV